jgi:hypothetical protein
MKQLHEKLQTLGHFFEPLYFCWTEPPKRSEVQYFAGSREPVQMHPDWFEPDVFLSNLDSQTSNEASCFGKMMLKGEAWLQRWKGRNEYGRNSAVRPGREVYT